MVVEPVTSLKASDRKTVSRFCASSTTVTNHADAGAAEDDQRVTRRSLRIRTKKVFNASSQRTTTNVTDDPPGNESSVLGRAGCNVHVQKAPFVLLHQRKKKMDSSSHAQDAKRSSSSQDDQLELFPFITPSPGKKQKRGTLTQSKILKDTAGSSIAPPHSESFLPIWSGTLRNSIFPSSCASSPILKDAVNDELVEPHTLILGTHPSVSSLRQQKYYGHPMNAFWWIAGDCLGFRRDSGVSKSKSSCNSSRPEGRPYKFASFLKYDGPILPYHEQVQLLTSKGFALWDVVASCQRPGSLDQDIVNEVPNDIRSFCNEHKSIRRIVLSNGASTLKFFGKHFEDWIKTGELQIHDLSNCDNCQPRTTNDKYQLSVKCRRALCACNSPDAKSDDRITLIPALSVSPAAATHSYQEKRDFWERHVYQPGLENYRNKVEANNGPF